MTGVYTIGEIRAVLPEVDVVEEIAQGFVAFSRGGVEVPPVGELLFPGNNGELHIKYGAIRGDEVCVIKVATGFFDNPKIGLPPFGGCMLVVSQKTGMIEAVLLEEGELTNHRTAAAGAVAARTLAPADPGMIGIVGCGVQARLQADYLRRVTDCRDLTVWARNVDQAEAAAADMTAMGYRVMVSQSLDELCDRSRLIVTTTPAEKPLLNTNMVRPGTHITAMGSDTPEKNEIAPKILALADVVVADSLAQSELRGEIYKARRAGVLPDDKAVELGAVICGEAKGRENDDQITLADLTGVAVQDIAIAKAVLNQLRTR
ncbi:MAG: ornithine cyclodeaminase family protein [Rhodobacteraceae bacterium]|nr:ornithine cyclodeaminase family protein [Paracoccaceae bacterium]